MFSGSLRHVDFHKIRPREIGKCGKNWSARLGNSNKEQIVRKGGGVVARSVVSNPVLPTTCGNDYSGRIIFNFNMADEYMRDRRQRHGQGPTASKGVELLSSG